MKSLTLVFLLMFSGTGLSQAPRSTVQDANRDWPSFWRQITAALKKKDHQALKEMMPVDFFDGGGGLTPAEWLQYIDENERRGSWRDIRRSFAQGTVINKNWSAEGTLTRVTRDNGYYFEFRKDKKWYFAGVVGD